MALGAEAVRQSPRGLRAPGQRRHVCGGRRCQAPATAPGESGAGGAGRARCQAPDVAPGETAREALHVQPEGAPPPPRLAGPDRRRPRGPARRADAPVVLHRRREGPRARRVPARRDRAQAAGPPSTLGPRLLRLRAARQDGSCAPRPRRSRGVVPDPRLLLLESERDLRARGRDPVPGGDERAGLRARGRGGDRRRGRDRRLHGHERLVGARSPARGDEGRTRPREGEGFRDESRPVRRHTGRVRRYRGRDGCSGQRRGALTRQPR